MKPPPFRLGPLLRLRAWEKREAAARLELASRQRAEREAAWTEQEARVAGGAESLRETRAGDFAAGNQGPQWLEFGDRLQARLAATQALEQAGREEQRRREELRIHREREFMLEKLRDRRVGALAAWARQKEDFEREDLTSRRFSGNPEAS